MMRLNCLKRSVWKTAGCRIDVELLFERNRTMALDTRELFESCALLEEKVSQLYYLFAGLYADIPELAALWNKTAEEEENHMRQFELAARIARSAPHSHSVDPALVGQALDMITRLTDKVRQTPPGWQGALKLAIDIEEKLARFHMDSVAVYDDDSINNLFKSMMSCDEQHVQSLRNYLERAGTAS